MPLGLSGAGRMPAIGVEHTRCEGALSSSCCALRTYRRRRYPSWNAGSIHLTGMALQLHKYNPLSTRYRPVCYHPRWLSARQSITHNQFLLSCEGTFLRNTRCGEGIGFSNSQLLEKLISAASRLVLSINKPKNINTKRNSPPKQEASQNTLCIATNQPKNRKITAP